MRALVLTIILLAGGVGCGGCLGDDEPGTDAGVTLDSTGTLQPPPPIHKCLIGWHWVDGQGCVHS